MHRVGLQHIAARAPQLDVAGQGHVGVDGALDAVGARERQGAFSRFVGRIEEVVLQAQLETFLRMR